MQQLRPNGGVAMMREAGKTGVERADVELQSLGTGKVTRRGSVAHSGALGIAGGLRGGISVPGLGLEVLGIAPGARLVGVGRARCTDFGGQESKKSNRREDRSGGPLNFFSDIFEACAQSFNECVHAINRSTD